MQKMPHSQLFGSKGEVVLHGVGIVSPANLHQEEQVKWGFSLWSVTM